MEFSIGCFRHVFVIDVISAQLIFPFLGLYDGRCHLGCLSANKCYFSPLSWSGNWMNTTHQRPNLTCWSFWHARSLTCYNFGSIEFCPIRWMQRWESIYLSFRDGLTWSCNGLGFMYRAPVMSVSSSAIIQVERTVTDRIVTCCSLYSKWVRSEPIFGSHSGDQDRLPHAITLKKLFRCRSFSYKITFVHKCNQDILVRSVVGNKSLKRLIKPKFI